MIYYDKNGECVEFRKKKNLGKSGRENPSGRYVFEMHREY